MVGERRRLLCNETAKVRLTSKTGVAAVKMASGITFGGRYHAIRARWRRTSISSSHRAKPLVSQG